MRLDSNSLLQSSTLKPITPMISLTKPEFIKPRPVIGQIVTVRGLECRITKVLPFGTIECESISTHHAFRVSGCMFTEK